MKYVDTFGTTQKCAASSLWKKGQSFAAQGQLEESCQKGRIFQQMKRPDKLPIVSITSPLGHKKRARVDFTGPHIFIEMPFFAFHKHPWIGSEVQWMSFMAY